MFAHPLENELAQSLHILGVSRIHDISEIVTNIHNHPEASLCSINRAHENFLHYALRHSAESFFLIYDHIKQSENIKQLITMPDRNGILLFCMSISWLNNLEIATQLFNHLESISSLEEAIQVFLVEKSGKTSALHEAATKTDPSLFNFILGKIKQTYCNRQVSAYKTRNSLFVNKNDCEDRNYATYLFVQIFAVTMLTSKSLTYIGKKMMNYQIIIPSILSTQITNIDTLLANFNDLDVISEKIKTLIDELKVKEKINFEEILNNITMVKEAIDFVSEGKVYKTGFVVEKNEQPSEMVALSM